MATTTVAKRSTGVPKGYVEHIRPVTKRSNDVRRAYASGQLKKRTRSRAPQNAQTANEEANAIQAVLGL